jgi:hypothetical protein
MSSSLHILRRIIALTLAVLLASCAGFEKVQREIATPESFQSLPDDRFEHLRDSSPFLKVHMQNGNTYVLQAWEMDASRQHVIGTGTLFNSVRDTLRHGEFRVGMDSVAIFETNVIHNSGTATALLIFTGITAAVTIYCIANPKSCFGSCPTFYVSDGDNLHLKAEGFSASIAPSLEATDIDALFQAPVNHQNFEIEMRNEALETHVVRYVDLLALPRAKGRSIFADIDGDFWESTSLIHPASAHAPEGDCLRLLLYADGNERYSGADSTYLGEKEIIEIEFTDIPHGPCGLVIGCRQTLLSTYLLYQTFAYMGKDVGYWFAQIERNAIKLTPNTIQRIMGGIEISVRDSLGDWKIVDQIEEYGPLATDIHLVQFGRLTGDTAQVRLNMTKGNWRIDYVALAELSRTVKAVHLHPHLVFKDGLVDEQARGMLCDSTLSLITLPGDIYTLRYHIPGDPGDYELFLQSRGYYLEWIRKEWIKEENPLFLSEIFFNPEAALKRLAPEFKQVEAEMEEHFWRSRYVRP